MADYNVPTEMKLISEDAQMSGMFGGVEHEDATFAILDYVASNARGYIIADGSRVNLHVHYESGHMEDWLVSDSCVYGVDADCLALEVAGMCSRFSYEIVMRWFGAEDLMN